MSEQGTVLLWSIGLFGVSLMVLGVLISVASFFSETRELQTNLEISAINASDRLDFTDFFNSGLVDEIVFEEEKLLSAISAEMSAYVRKHGKYEITYWQVNGREFWLEISKPWKSPFGNFSVLPEALAASIHVSLDQNRHAQ